MAIDGECITQLTGVIPANPVASGSSVNVPVNPLPGCCNDFVLKVLADNSGDPLKNDEDTVIWWFDSIISAAVLKLQKYTSGAWSYLATIADNQFGTFGDFGYYTNNEGQNFISLRVSFAAILLAHGEGSYRFKCTYTNPITSVDTPVYSNEYCLKTYSDILADGTVRLECWNGGVLGDREDDTKIKNYGTLSVYNSLRLRGFFGYPTAEYKQDDVEYNTGQRLFVEDEQSPEYQMTLFLQPFFVHEMVRTDFMMADELAITDYNSKNNAEYVQKYVRPTSAYKPNWYKLQSNLATVELTFKPAYNRHRKLRN